MSVIPTPSWQRRRGRRDLLYSGRVGMCRTAASRWGSLRAGLYTRCMHRYHVYIMASRSRRIYAGVTGALEHRVLQHKHGEVAFTAKYRMTRLVLVESTHSIEAAIAREKQIKGWRRSKKL